MNTPSNTKNEVNPEDSYTDRVKLSRIKKALSNSTGNMVGVLGGAWFVTFAIYKYSNIHYLIAWHVILHTLVGAVFLYMRRHPINKIKSQEASRVAFVRMALGSLIGLTWGVLPLFPLSNEPLLLRTFLFVAISAIGAVGSIGFSVFLPFVYILITVSFGPIILWFFLESSLFSILMGLSGIVWIILTLKTAFQIGRSQITEIELREKINDEMKKLEEANIRIAELANHDALTGLANRRLFAETFKHFVAVARREKRKFGLLMIDLNKFKQVNDTFGHHAGDSLLKEVSTRIDRCCREVDCVARMGGDEFSVLVDHVTERTDLEIIALKLIETINQPFTIDNREVRIGASIGIAIWPDHGTKFEHLQHAADQAMYMAKQQEIGSLQYAETVTA